MFHLDAQTPFLFDWKWLAPTGLRTKDFIVPSSFKFGERQRFDMGSKVSAVSFFSILRPNSMTAVWRSSSQWIPPLW